MPTDTPKVFICSTVYDFRDLRSALREWLEEFGYEVLVSERTDFPQSPDSNSYKSCLDAIDKADYFLLFVGSRVGGWYDKDKLISITRAEYRHAHERFKEGKLKLLAFVRQEVWDIKEDREALRRFLEADESIQEELSETDKVRVVHHPSKFATNAKAIFEFVDEIRKVSEMKQAEPGAGPPGNWVYQFTSFKDVIDACKTVMNLSGSLRRKATTANLLYELEYNLTELLARHEGQGLRHSFWTKEALDAFRDDLGGSCELTDAAIRKLRFFTNLIVDCGRRLRTAALREAITSGELLEYDKVLGQYEAGLLHHALVLLEEQIMRLRSFDDGHAAQPLNALLQKRKPSSEVHGTFVVKSVDVAVGLSLRNCYENIVTLSRAIHHFLSGDETELLRYKHLSTSPFSAEAEKIKSEKLSKEELHRWLYPPQATSNNAHSDD